MSTLTKLRDLMERTEATLLQDVIGVTALGVMLIAALHLPAFT